MKAEAKAEVKLDPIGGEGEGGGEGGDKGGGEGGGEASEVGGEGGEDGGGAGEAGLMDDSFGSALARLAEVAPDENKGRSTGAAVYGWWWSSMVALA